MSEPPVSAELTEAREPRTPPHRLTELAEHQDAPVRAAVACNPSTPPEALRRLAWRHWSSVSRNPALPLLLLHDPGWFASLDARTVEEILCVPETASAWWPLFAAHPIAAFVALEARRLDIFLALLAAGANPCETREVYADGNVHFFSLLEAAVDCDLGEAVVALMHTGQVGASEPLRCLNKALVVGSVGVANTLLSGGVRWGRPLLDAACLGELAEVARLSPGAPLTDLRDALAGASLLGQADVVRALLGAVERVDERSCWSRTALWMAVHAGQREIVALLLDAGAHPLCPSWHETPLQEAERLGDPGILAVLRRAAPSSEVRGG